MGLGSGQFVYEEAEDWGKVPDGWKIVEVPGVAVDSQDRVYAFCRSEHPIIVFDREGRFSAVVGRGADQTRPRHCNWSGRCRLLRRRLGPCRA